MIVLYTIDCESCLRLEKKLQDKNIAYATCKDTNKMAELGMSHMPVLQIEDGSFLSFKQAMKWADSIGDDNNV